MRLVASMVKAKRKQLAAMQAGIDPLTGYKLSDDPSKLVLDHCHRSGFIRATLDRWNNGVLGKIENWANRIGADPATGVKIPAWTYLRNIADYLELHEASQHNGLLHPTHKTEREKADLRNKKARKARITAKAKATLTEVKSNDEAN